MDLVLHRWRIARCSALSLIAVAALAGNAGCMRRGGPVPYDAALLSTPDPRPASLSYDLPLGPLDMIHVTVLNVPSLSGDYQIDSHGYVDLPLLGAIEARDSSARDFAMTLKRLYAARYLNNPDITVRVLQTSSANVTVEGGVRSPGIYALPGQTQLLGVIALARGVDPDNGNPRRCVILRKQNGRTVAAAFDLRDIRRGRMVDPLVYPGDTIIVESDTLRQFYRDLVQTLPAVAIFSQL